MNILSTKGRSIQEIASRFFAQFDPKNQYESCELFAQMENDLATLCDSMEDCFCNENSCTPSTTAESSENMGCCEGPSTGTSDCSTSENSCCDSTQDLSSCETASSVKPNAFTLDVKSLSIETSNLGSNETNACCDTSSAPAECSSSDDSCCNSASCSDVQEVGNNKNDCSSLASEFFGKYEGVEPFLNCHLANEMQTELSLMCSDFETYFFKLFPEDKGTYKGKAYDFTSVIPRVGNGDIKTNKDLVKNMLGLNYYDDSISMWVADMDFSTAPQVKESLQLRIDQGILGYTMADNDYYQSIIRWYKRRHNMHIDKSWLLYSPGTIAAIRNSIQTYTAPNEGVIIQPPVYFPFESQVKSSGRKVLRNELIQDEDGTYRIDFEDFEEKAKDPNTKMFILCNPHNPIGQIWSKEDVQRMVSITRKYNVVVFADEIHADLIRKESTFHSVLNMENSDLTVVATALNKTFNLAGLHLTNLIISNPELKKKYENHTGWVGASPMVLEATKAALNYSEDWVTSLNEVIDDNLNYVSEFIKEKMPLVRFVRPEGTYLTWMDFRAYGIEEQKLLEKIADEAHLVLEGGSMFGESAKGYIRMNVALPKSTLTEAMDRLYRCLKNA